MTSPAPIPRGPWGPVATIAFTCVIAGAFMLVQIALAVPYLLMTVKQTSPAAIEAAALSLESDGRFLSFAEVFSGTTAVGLTLLFAWLRRGPAVREYLALGGVPRPTALRWLLYTVSLGVLLEVASQLAGYPAVPEWMLNIYRSAGSLPLLVFALLVVAPVVEELVFRGFLFAGLRRSWLGDTGTILVASAVWAAIHLQYRAFYVGQVFCLGLLLGAARVRTGSVVLAMGMHALFSAVAMIQLALEAR